MSIQDQYLPKKEDYEQLQETFNTFLKVKKLMCSSADVFSRFSVHYSSSLAIPTYSTIVSPKNKS